MEREPNRTPSFAKLMSMDVRDWEEFALRAIKTEDTGQRRGALRVLHQSIQHKASHALVDRNFDVAAKISSLLKSMIACVEGKLKETKNDNLFSLMSFWKGLRSMLLHIKDLDTPDRSMDWMLACDRRIRAFQVCLQSDTLVTQRMMLSCIGGPACEASAVLDRMVDLYLLSTIENHDGEWLFELGIYGAILASKYFKVFDVEMTEARVRRLKGAPS